MTEFKGPYHLVNYGVLFERSDEYGNVYIQTLHADAPDADAFHIQYSDGSHYFHSPQTSYWTSDRNANGTVVNGLEEHYWPRGRATGETEYIRFEGKDWVELKNEKLMVDGLDWKERIRGCRVERVVVGASRQEWYLRHAEIGETAADEGAESTEQETSEEGMNLDKELSGMARTEPANLNQRQSEARVILQGTSMRSTRERLHHDALMICEDEEQMGFEALREMEEEEWYAEQAYKLELEGEWYAEHARIELEEQEFHVEDAYELEMEWYAEHAYKLEEEMWEIKNEMEVEEELWRIEHGEELSDEDDWGV